MKKLFVLLFVLLGLGFSNQAQVMDTPRDGVYDKIHTINREPVPYAHLREADAFWAKRVWRVIDLREKVNHPLYYPNKPTNGRINLIGVLLQGLEEGSITAYGADNDEFTVPLTTEEIMKKLSKSDTIRDRFDPITYEPLPDTVIVTDFDASTVTMFRVKEDWFFDKQRSVLDVRILGLCPIREDYDQEGNLRGTRADFWIYFPDARQILVKNEVFNRFNDGQRLSYDDWFFKRFFGSYIVKESNVYDRYINMYATGLDGLLESERIDNDIFVFEHDLWEL